MERQAQLFCHSYEFPPAEASNKFPRRNPGCKVRMKTFSPVRLSISTVGTGLERVNFDCEVFQRFGNGHRIGRGSF